jgi:hypothetical protein
MGLLAGCAGPKQTAEPVPQPDEHASLPRVTVTAAQENVRATPNGDIVAKAHRGERYPTTMRRGNWVEIVHPDAGRAWIWAPSLEGMGSVNPMDLTLWLGGADGPATEPELKRIFGPPTMIQPITTVAVIYTWENGRDGALFGDNRFRTVQTWVDVATREVVRVAFELPPFEGEYKELLSRLALPEKRGKADFERVRFNHAFAGISLLEMLYYEGDIRRIATVVADRFAPGGWHTEVSVGEGKKATIGEDGNLVLVMPLSNQSRSVAWGAPLVDVEMYVGSRPEGSWRLGPGGLRLEPGEAAELRLPMPVEAASVDMMKTSVSANIVEMLPLPPAEGVVP